MKIANEHNELKTKFIQNISSNGTDFEYVGYFCRRTVTESPSKKLAQMQGQVAALKKFSDDIQELSSFGKFINRTLYDSLEINVGTFCENVMDKG